MTTGEFARDATLVDLLGVLEGSLADWPVATNARDRAAGIETAMIAISEQGIDADAYLRYALGHALAFAVVLAVLLPDDEAPSGTGGLALDVAQWRHSLQCDTKLDARSIAEADLEVVEAGFVSDDLQSLGHEVARLVPAVLRWVQNAPVRELMTLSAPSRQRLAEYGLRASPSEEMVGSYVWLRQRAGVDPTEWSTDALHREYRWRMGETGIGFSDSVLESMTVDFNGVVAQIAARAVDVGSRERRDDAMFWEMLEQAKQYLQLGRFREAAALFDFYARSHPDDALALNNRAFCTIPIDPAESLDGLDRADRAGYSERSILVYNRCCCLALLSREAEAVSLAEYYWQRERSDLKTGAYLWVPDGDGWRLDSVVDVEFSLANLLAMLAHAAGDERRAQVWTARRDELEVSAPDGS